MVLDVKSAFPDGELVIMPRTNVYCYRVKGLRG
jgi:hypothetical protein